MIAYMKNFFTILFLALCVSVFGQFETVNVTIIDNLNQNNSKNKTQLDSIDCLGDTLQYGRFKARSLRPITSSLGFSIGQFYTAPGNVEVSGYTFYAWALPQGSTDSIDIFCHIYAIDTDSLPTGNPLRTDTLRIDTAFNGGQLALLERHAKFASPVTFNQPFIVVIGVVDSGRLGVVCNDWANREGRQENLLRGTVAGTTWYKGLNLNIGGAQLDCDVLLEPHVKYKFKANFDFDDCYNFRDTVKFTNTSSGFLSDPMYNRWAFSNNTNISSLWNYGHNFGTTFREDGEVKYNVAGDYTVRLITRLLHFKNTTYCYDTIEKRITYLPDFPTLSGVRMDSVCAGDSSVIIATSNSDLFWFTGIADTAFFQTGNTYRSGALFNSDTLYIEAKNGHCITERREHIIKVNQVPTITSVNGDSICSGASANLSASSDYGEIDWYVAPMGSSPFYRGNIYITSLLTSGLTYYVEANNSGCRSINRVAVSAEVGIEFAPNNPDIYKDTVLCRKDGNAWLKVNNPNNLIRWYNQPSGGTPIATGDSFQLQLLQGVGQQMVYVDAFDGRCPSSRVGVTVFIKNVPTFGLNVNEPIEVCNGQSATIDLKLSAGSALWYESAGSSNSFLDHNSYTVDEVLDPIELFFVPYESLCFDEKRYAIKINPIDFGMFNHVNRIKEVCQNTPVNLEVDLILGEAKWYANDSITASIFSGRLFPSDGFEKSTDYYVVADNKGCKSSPILYQVKVNPRANAAFNFDILGAGNFRFSAQQIGQGFYVWDLGDGNTGSGGQITHQYKSNGNFEVRLVVIPQNECNDTFSRMMQVSGLVNINQLAQNRFSLYPNPASNSINIELPTSKEVQGSIINLQGKEVISMTIKGSQSIDVSGLSSGIYFVLLENFAAQKLVITNNKK